MPKTDPIAGKILALDYGQSSIGLAVCDETREFIFGRGIVKTTKGYKPVFEKILNLCQTEKIKMVVIGLPLSDEGEETAQTKRIRSFAEQLKTKLDNVQVVFEDESFTSFEADQHLEALELPDRHDYHHQKSLQDELAAILILKRYLKRQ